MRLRTILSAMAVFAASAIPAFSQFSANGQCRGSGSAMTATIQVYPFHQNMRPVTGAPYSAREFSESVQTLADGTHLTEKAQSEIATWRDAFGRVRTENHAAPGAPERCGSFLAQIQDPIAGYTYVIDPVSQVVHRLPLVSRAALSAGEAALDQPPDRPGGPAKTSETLGTKTMHGVSVVGTRRTRATPAGRGSGDGGTVTVTTESWMAPQLALVVYEKTSNPASGVERTATVKDLNTAAPDASLFAVPAGYKMVDEGGPFTIKIAGDDAPAPRNQFGANISCDKSGAATASFNYPVPWQMQPVTGAPYSARESFGTARTLAGGTEEPRTRADERLLWRDSSGRTRLEHRASPAAQEACGSFLADVEDPVAGYYYIIDRVNQVAHRLALKTRPARSASEMTLDQPPPRPDGPRKTTEPLGAKTMFGVTVVGARETVTYPAGSMGNDRPLTSTHETWTAPQLGLVVYSKNSGPVGNERTTAFTELSAAEPDPSLFRVPAGFKIVDETGPFTIRTKGRD